MFHFDPYSPAIDADPFPYYKQLRDEAPCHWSPEAQMWILSRYADIVSAGQDWQTYSSASGNLMTELPGRAGATLGSSDPPKHDRLRGLIQHAFMKRNLLALEEPIRAVAQEVFGQLRGSRQFDFKEVSSQFTVKVLMAALGLPMGDEALVPEHEVRENAVLMVQSDARTRAKGPEHIAAYNWMQEYAAKAQVAARLAGDVVHIGVGVLALVAVARAIGQADKVALLHGLPVQLHVFHQATAEALGRGV